MWKIQKRISVFSFEGMRKGRQVKNLSFFVIPVHSWDPTGYFVACVKSYRNAYD